MAITYGSNRIDRGPGHVLMRGLLQLIADGDRHGREQRTETDVAVMRRSRMLMNKKTTIG